MKRSELKVEMKVAVVSGTTGRYRYFSWTPVKVKAVEPYKRTHALWSTGPRYLKGGNGGVLVTDGRGYESVVRLQDIWTIEAAKDHEAKRKAANAAAAAHKQTVSDRQAATTRRICAALQARGLDVSISVEGAYVRLDVAALEQLLGL